MVRRRAGGGRRWTRASIGAAAVFVAMGACQMGVDIRPDGTVDSSLAQGISEELDLVAVAELEQGRAGNGLVVTVVNSGLGEAPDYVRGATTRQVARVVRDRYAELDSIDTLAVQYVEVRPAAEGGCGRFRPTTVARRDRELTREQLLALPGAAGGASPAAAAPAPPGEPTPSPSAPAADSGQAPDTAPPSSSGPVSPR